MSWPKAKGKDKGEKAWSLLLRSFDIMAEGTTDEGEHTPYRGILLFWKGDFGHFARLAVCDATKKQCRANAVW
jgi:hypothetical protein